MSKQVELRSESGRWTRRTTTSDSLFQPILGCMTEEGLVIPDVLTLTGSVGEELDKNWFSVECVLDWMDWYEAMKKWDSRVQRPTFPPVVYLHKIRVLSHILNLPIGWEAFVVVDPWHTTLTERVTHAKVVLEWMKERYNVRIAHYDITAGQMLASANACKDDYTLFHADENWPMGWNKLFLSLLDPFILSLWMSKMHNCVGTHVYELKMTEVLLYLDWEGVTAFLADYTDTKYDNIKNLTDLITGKGHLFDSSTTGDYLVDTERAMDTRPYNHLSPLKYIDQTMLLYKRLLYTCPDECDPFLLGLEPILGIPVQAWCDRRTIPYSSHYTYSQTTGVSVYVAWVNAAVLTYPAWYTSNALSSMYEDKNERHYSGIVRIPLSDFPLLVPYLHETLGIGIMRRMMRSLQAYIHDAPCLSDDSVAVLQEVEYRDQDARERITKRVTVFVTLLEKYVSEHAGEDESMKTLDVMNTTYMRTLRVKYDE